MRTPQINIDHDTVVVLAPDLSMVLCMAVCSRLACTWQAVQFSSQQWEEHGSCRTTSADALELGTRSTPGTLRPCCRLLVAYSSDLLWPRLDHGKQPAEDMDDPTQ